jgi:voltage-gated potassium channel Kch
MASASRKVSTGDKIRYAFDKSMAKGPVALIGWLALISAFFITLAALVLTITGIRPEGGENLSFFEAAWQSLMRTLDSGTMGGDAGWGFRIVMLLVTLGGIFIVSSLIGVLTSGIEGKMDQLRKGRSFVIESGHTLILGWSSSVFTIVSELVLANENQKAPRIVVLADKDTVEMQEEIRDKVGPTGRTRIICRTGSPIDLYDLEIANPHRAKSIIILSPEEGDPDAQVIKSILALTNNPRRRAEPYHIVAEIRDAENMEAARLVGRDEAQIVLSNDLIARITVQTCRQSGLSTIYTELLDHGGDEIYFKEEPALVGRTFGAAISAYEDSAVMGLQFSDGRVRVNPPMDMPIASGDKVIVISADDDTIRLNTAGTPPIDAAAIRAAQPTPATTERTLVLGWNSRGPSVIEEMDSYVAPGSELVVVADSPQVQTEVEAAAAQVKNLRVALRAGNTSDKNTLEALDAPSYGHVIVLGYTDSMEVQRADSHTLITLLHLRNIEEKSGRPLSIVSEMADVRNRELAEVTQADDFIVSNKLISLLMAQVSENKHLNAVFTDLLSSEGSEIHLKPAADYVVLGQPLNFYTIVEAARARGEVALGYRHEALARDAKQGYGVRLNPPKSQAVTLSAGDRIIVLAES